MVAVSLKKFFQAEDGIREFYGCLVGSEMCIRDRAEQGKAGKKELTPEEIYADTLKSAFTTSELLCCLLLLC